MKLHKLKVKINSRKVDEIYGLDTSGNSRLKQGNKIKDGFLTEFCFDSDRVVEVGFFIVCTLINLTSFSVVDVQIYPINKSKKETWD